MAACCPGRASNAIRTPIRRLWSALFGKVAADERRLKITVDCDGEEISLWVDDNGPGIATDVIDRIFEPLATWKPGGTGMGLAISNSIVQFHGGRMFAENRPKGGARVGFALPVSKTAREA